MLPDQIGRLTEFLAAMDLLAGTTNNHSSEKAEIMATAETMAHEPYLKPIDPDTLRRSNAEMVAILDDWEENGDEQDQRETMSVLREALGPSRTMSDRSAFKP